MKWTDNGWAIWGPPGDQRSIYRYVLGREWDATRKPCAFIGLNPSTATETDDDPTVRRCIRFARDNGFGGLRMLNIFAFRSTDPAGLKRCAQGPVGPENDRYIVETVRGAGMAVAAWGVHGALLDRGEQVRSLIRAAGLELHVLRLTKDGHPSHPLYLPATLKPVIWRER